MKNRRPESRKEAAAPRETEAAGRGETAPSMEPQSSTASPFQTMGPRTLRRSLFGLFLAPLLGILPLPLAVLLLAFAAGGHGSSGGGLLFFILTPMFGVYLLGFPAIIAFFIAHILLFRRGWTRLRHYLPLGALFAALNIALLFAVEAIWGSPETAALRPTLGGMLVSILQSGLAGLIGALSFWFIVYWRNNETQPASQVPQPSPASHVQAR